MCVQLKDEQNFIEDHEFITKFPKYADILHKNNIRQVYHRVEIFRFEDGHCSCPVSILLTDNNDKQFFGLGYDVYDALFEVNEELQTCLALEEAISNMKNGKKI